MNIIKAQYISLFSDNKNSSIKATIDGVEMFVPLDEGNRHYSEIMRQFESGELTIDAAE